MNTGTEMTDRLPEAHGEDQADRYLNSPELSRQLRRIASRVCMRTGRPELLEDAYQEAWAACAESAHKYGAHRRLPIAAYAGSRAYWAVLHFCRANSGAFSIPERMWRQRGQARNEDLSAAIYAQSLQQSEPDDEDGGLSDRMERVSSTDAIGGVYQCRTSRDDGMWRGLEHGRLRGLIEWLEPNERHIIQQFGDGVECASIARDLGISRQRVHQILHRAFSKIRGWWETSAAA